MLKEKLTHLVWGTFAINKNYMHTIRWMIHLKNYITLRIGYLVGKVEKMTTLEEPFLFHVKPREKWRAITETTFSLNIGKMLKVGFLSLKHLKIIKITDTRKDAGDALFA